MRRLIVLFAFVLMGCAGPQFTGGSDLPLSPQMISAAEQAIADTLKDPLAAQFRSVTGYAAPNGVAVCGQVNGKNSYGGYVGFKRFYVLLHDNGGTYATSGAYLEGPNPVDAQLYEGFFPGCLH